MSVKDKIVICPSCDEIQQLNYQMYYIADQYICWECAKEFLEQLSFDALFDLLSIHHISVAEYLENEKCLRNDFIFDEMREEKLINCE